MGKQFEFSDFVDEFKVPFFILENSSGGDWEDGDWVPNARTSETAHEGIVLPLSEDDLKYAENGRYSVKEKKLYTTFPIVEGTQIRYKNDIYTVQSLKDYSEYADVYIYFMRWREQ